MSPTRLGYNDLGLDLIETFQDQPRKPRRPPMGEKKKDDGVGDPIKIFLKEALEKQRNTKMDNFSHILQRLPTGGASASSSHSRAETHFKVQVKFEIPIFHRQIDVDVVHIWLNLLEEYFSVNYFSLPKSIPHIKDWRETYYEQNDERKPSLFSATVT